MDRVHAAYGDEVGRVVLICTHDLHVRAMVVPEVHIVVVVGVVVVVVAYKSARQTRAGLGLFLSESFYIRSPSLLCYVSSSQSQQIHSPNLFCRHFSALVRRIFLAFEAQTGHISRLDPAETPRQPLHPSNSPGRPPKEPPTQVVKYSKTCLLSSKRLPTHSISTDTRRRNTTRASPLQHSQPRRSQTSPRALYSITTRSPSYLCSAALVQVRVDRVGIRSID